MNLPIEFTRQAQELFGNDYESFLQAIQHESQTSIRRNPLKPFPIPPLPKVDWCDTGYYTPQRPDFTFDPLFHGGCYYVQEASSMFLQQVIRQHTGDSPVRYLDLCAAPGGKTTLALSALPEGSFVVANEPVRQRANVLAENLSKWGYPNMMVVNNYPSDFTHLSECFDVVLTDVPCSGEGMFRKDPDAITEWSPANVRKCTARQQDIVDMAWELLREGGLLIYSTCTYNTSENEEMIEYLTREKGGEALLVEIDGQWGIHGALKGSKPVYRFLPHKTRGEGLFMAAVRKPIEGFQAIRREPKWKNRSKPQPKNIVSFNSHGWLRRPEQFEFVVQPERITAIDRRHTSFARSVAESLRTVLCGIEVASLKGKEWMPSQSLALSVELNHTSFHHVELDLKSAIAYLRCEALALPEQTPKGIVLIIYKQTPLGWAKNIGNRANNLYPTEWRIRSGYLPETITCLTDLTDPT